MGELLPEVSATDSGLARRQTNTYFKTSTMQPAWWLIADFSGGSIGMDIWTTSYLNNIPNKLTIWANAYPGQDPVVRANKNGIPITDKSIKYKKTASGGIQIWLNAGSLTMTISGGGNYGDIILQDPPEDAISVTQGYSAV